jgi:hypothetical protein
MGRKRHGKLNWLQRSLPEGLLVDAAWLEQRGYSSALRSKYVTHGWLDQVARGVFRRPAAKLPAPDPAPDLQWQHVVISLHTLLGYPVAVGGRTALELQGFGHYLSATGPREVHLYSDQDPPGWVFRLPLRTRLVFHPATKLLRSGAVPAGGVPAGNARGSAHASLIAEPWGHWNWPLVMSTPERAILELLNEVPQRETFHQADMLMDGLRNLSPRRLQTLLVECRSVKVKRLFLWFAERHHHAWLHKLDRRRIDLGHGKRMLVRGGKLDKKFNITVPGTLDAPV